MATKRKRSCSKEDDSRTAVDRKITRAKDSSVIQEQLNSLLDLGQGPLSDILEFCNAVDLAQVEMVCKTLQTAAIPMWKSLAECLPAPIAPEVNLFGQDESAKNRVGRWNIAAAYSKHMEEVAAEHFNYDDGRNTVVRCNGCNDLPSLDIRFLEDPNKVFFIRLSYRSPVDGNARATQDDDDPLMICQGFIPKIPDPNRTHVLRRFDITDVLSREDETLVWPELQQLSDFCTQHGNELLTIELLVQFMEMNRALLHNAAVTVIAMERSGICRLVVATGGYDQIHDGSAFQTRTYLPHQIDSLRVRAKIRRADSVLRRYHLESEYG